MMKILITGSKGFIGKNLVYKCLQEGYEVIEFDRDNSINDLASKIHEADFIMHLAGINRPKETNEFYEGNYDLTQKIIDFVKPENRNIPILLSSSIHAAVDNDYGKSKKMAEDTLFNFSRETENPVFVYRLANTFGKWCKPNYNSVIATFCYNIAHGKDIQINDRDTELPLVYIDDIVDSFISCIGKEANGSIKNVEPIYKIKLGEVADLLYKFKNSRDDLFVPNLSNGFEKKLYSTYLSYLPEDEFSYPLKMNVDNRGSFTEFVKTVDRGQVSINISKPGIVKGNHWHHTKNEKFLVVSGKGIIRFRDVNSSEIIEYLVSGEKLEVIDIPVGYTHNIENIGDTDMVTVMWCNEIFDKDNPDTYYLEV
ncbi:UDP-2-acetamido-2,6-beta-L-arabino-hexul-4-ose reductase [Anaerorhabdus furcosa]|uniref:UDP-2-acetamido-2,6-beta-L-arabino-hexul-4-ose reductase n=2 Tax=Anaerorhabdus furcosa TaxID=118967 RepID=A0A1T4LU26_9FIRM|nr:UDP-2-acetamido-2,6-beta-L-arabino-hexul-4-ose reductase [Anaerorhabdus furcosa]